LKFKIPVFGGLMKTVALARFPRNFSALLQAGVPILTALDIVGETSGNVVITRAIEDVKESVRSGSGMAAPFAQHTIFPAMVVQMIAVGEDTGELDAMLSKIADFYDAEAQATTEQLTSLIEPIMIVGLGITIGVMVISLYLPIFNIYELMDN
ncbi:MAG: type II secretion system F family protein, partial [Candidatus Nanopelagicales bacterium]